MKKYTLFLIIFLTGAHTYSQVPAINSFSPNNGPVGTSVIITGNNFSSIPENNIVFFGAVKAIVNAASSSQLTVNVPISSTYNYISVTINGLTGYSNLPFVVTFPGGTPISSLNYSSKISCCNSIWMQVCCAVYFR